MSPPTAYETISRKRYGEALSDAEIRSFIERFTATQIADYQMSALLMAIAIRGMTPGETASLTRAMLDSGDRWNLREEVDFIADKHSTGGVGDKISLPLTPWVASCGVKIAMLSGRGLGHTGGTLDKLETVPGFNARLSREELLATVERAGGAIATSTARIAPADRRIYALRDVTATVDSIPLITASIMSKKLAMGASALLLDVKCGRGAFMQTLAAAEELAQSLIAAAEGSGTAVEALITDMSRPLGHAIGNANEVAESFDVLRGAGPEDVTALTRAQAVRILVRSGRFDEQTAAAALDEAISSGRALDSCRRWIEAQGGDPAVVDSPERLPQPRREIEVTAPASGFIQSLDPLAVGQLAVELGAGRLRQEDEIDPGAGIVVLRNRGNQVKAGEPIARIQLGRKDLADDELASRYQTFLSIGDTPPEELPLVLKTISTEPAR
jgi:pyrimidine-nucleoside phosphorylase